MRKEHEHIDEIFRDAFDGMEATPNENLWDNIANDISEEGMDNLFKDALETEMAQPSEKVWEGVKENLPLNLRLKRNLSRLSYVAGVVVIGMLMITIYLSLQSEDIIPIPLEKETPVYNIEIAIEEVSEPTIEEVTPMQEIEKGFATDNSLREKIQSVELNTEDEFVFDIDKEKIHNILEPLKPLPIDSAIARVNGSNENDTETEHGIIIPENFEETILPNNKEKETP